MTRKLTVATALTASLALLATGCSASTDNTAPTGSPAATSTSSTTTAPAPTPSTATHTPTVTEVSPTSATPTPTVSLDPSPLAGVGVGEQQPSSEAVLTSISDEDRARAVDAAKAIVTAYTSGKDYKEWSAELFPSSTPNSRTNTVLRPKPIFSRAKSLEPPSLMTQLLKQPWAKTPTG